MALQGTFDILDFGEVLHLLADHELTGRLHVRSRSFAANLFFESGLLAGADQSEHPTAGASGDVQGRLEEVCFEMLDTERGNFEFQPGKATSLPGAPRHRVEDLLSESRRRLEEWRELQEIIPSLELQPRLVLDLTKAEVTIDRDRWRVLTAVDGRRNLRAIGRILGLSDFEVCRVMRTLLEEGVVELEGLAALAASRDIMPTVPTPDSSSSDAFTISARAVPDPVGVSDPELVAGPLVVDDAEQVVVVAGGSGATPPIPTPPARSRVPGARRGADAAPGADPSEPAPTGTASTGTASTGTGQGGTAPGGAASGDAPSADPPDGAGPGAEPARPEPAGDGATAQDDTGRRRGRLIRIRSRQEEPSS